MLSEQLEFFIANQDSLVAKYRGKHIVIANQKVVGVYDTPLDAYIEAKKKYETGTFLIQPCEPGPEAYTVTISTIDLFA